jgi:hypothetical protein
MPSAHNGVGAAPLEAAAAALADASACSHVHAGAGAEDITTIGAELHCAAGAGAACPHAAAITGTVPMHDTSVAHGMDLRPGKLNILTLT